MKEQKGYAVYIQLIGKEEVEEFICKADGYIPGTSIRFFIGKNGIRYEVDMRNAVVTFSKERESFIPKEQK